jgi:predicted 3-demethylubiquinone-9 3-methyltransferase (glyoxalase superfamily)
MKSKITTFLWFDKQAEEAMNFYVSVFSGSPNKTGESKILHIQRYPEGPLEGPMKGFEGKVLTGVFELDGQKFMALDGGPIFKFNESISLLVQADTQEEIDYFWDKLSAVPSSEQCGWLKDKYGLSWQIVPDILGSKYLSDPKKSRKVIPVFMRMKKIVLADLEKAYNS